MDSPKIYQCLVILFFAGVDAANAPCILSTYKEILLCWSGGKWVNRPLHLPAGVGSLTKVTIDGEQCFIGGLINNNLRSKAAYCYEKGNFVHKPEYDMDEVTTRAEAVALTLGGMECLVGGFGGSAGKYVSFSSTACWNSTAKKWHLNTNYVLNTPRHAPGLLNYNGTYCLVGGMDLTGICAENTECFDKSLHGGRGGWKPMTSLHTPKGGTYMAATIVLNGTECLVGGEFRSDILCLDSKDGKLVQKPDLDGESTCPSAITLDGLRCMTTHGKTIYCVTSAGVLKKNSKYDFPGEVSAVLVYDLPLS